MMGKLNTSNQL